MELEQEKSKFICPECGIKCKNPGALATHRIIHLKRHIAGQTPPEAPLSGEASPLEQGPALSEPPAVETQPPAPQGQPPQAPPTGEAPPPVKETPPMTFEMARYSELAGQVSELRHMLQELTNNIRPIIDLFNQLTTGGQQPAPQQQQQQQVAQQQQQPAAQGEIVQPQPGGLIALARDLAPVIALFRPTPQESPSPLDTTFFGAVTKIMDMIWKIEDKTLDRASRLWIGGKSPHVPEEEGG